MIENGGIFDCSLPIDFRIVFRRQSDGQERTLDSSITLNFVTSAWSITVDPGLDVLAPGNGNFVPGVANGGGVIPLIGISSGESVTHEVLPAPGLQIPTVTVWGMLAMVLLMLAAGTVVYRRLRLEAPQVA